MTNNAWYIDAGSFADAIAAKRVAAIFNHQGPQIPAHTITRGGVHQVVAGPFESAETANSVAQRIQREFEHTTQILPPGSLHSFTKKSPYVSG
jgi:L,D-transpeptidase ErfK/SrfK